MAAALALIYWLVVLTEGAYLGPGAVTALYNRFAPRYDAIKQFDDEDEAYFLGRPIARFLAARTGSAGDPPWLLDVATGTGRLPLTVLGTAPGACRIIALDRAEAMLAQARRKLAAQGEDAHQVVFLAHDASRLPFAADQFAVVTCLEALEFMPAPEAALAEALRVTQPGGLLVTTNRIGREARLMPGRIFDRERLAALLRERGAAGVEIMPWQVDYDLVFAVKQGQAPVGTASAWRETLRCPRCGGQPAPSGPEGAETVACPDCRWRLAQVDGLWRQQP
jgi:ubiquinone/menaquinone biosynthesis C-methylase UbiE